MNAISQTEQLILDEGDRADTHDPLRNARAEFFIPDASLAYLDGNSLGMAPRSTLTRLNTLMSTEWARDLISSWQQWVDMPIEVGDQLAPLIGAEPGEVIVHDSTTINLYQLITAAMHIQNQRSVIAVASGEFPTDRYVVQELANDYGWHIQEHFDSFENVGVVVRSLIDYRTAEVTDMAAEEQRAREAGALTVWDLSHAVGVYPVKLHDANAQFAVGCTYKFLNGGPGSPGFSYVHRDLIEGLDKPIHGWFSQRNQFAMAPTYAPRPDIGKLMTGTPSILALAAAQEGIALTAKYRIGAIYHKCQSIGDFTMWCISQLGLKSNSPTDSARRGGHVGVIHPKAREIVVGLARDHGILADFREPDVIRLGLSPLTTRYSDAARAVVAIGKLASEYGTG